VRWLLYRLGIVGYGWLLRLAAPFHPKARAWIQGRRGWRARWAQLAQTEGPWIWMHCASLGEFEQGRNLIDAIKTRHPQYRILVTFFSPSGYRIRHSYPQADAVEYLPLDTPAHARRIAAALRPVLAFWIKYELWLHTLRELQQRGVPVLLVAARIGTNSAFVRGGLAPLYRSVLGQMAHIFTQDEGTRHLLAQHLDPSRVSVSADTRYDRVQANRDSFQPRPEIEAFVRGRLCLLGGSVWPTGEDLLHQVYDQWQGEPDFCLILAPHELHPERIARWEQRYPGQALRHSQLDQLREEHRILWIDNVGMLAQLYHYADLAYVGGGWGTGLHNILEPAAFGCPVVFGPQHAKFPEAQDLIDHGGAQALSSVEAGAQAISQLLRHAEQRARMQQASQTFIAQRVGATDRILDWCYAQGLLPSR